MEKWSIFVMSLNMYNMIKTQLDIMNQKLRHQMIDMGQRCMKNYKKVKEKLRK